MLEARGKVKSYGRTRALTGVSLEIAEGEIVAITGSGKSTLLHCLAGIIRPRPERSSWTAGGSTRWPRRS